MLRDAPENRSGAHILDEVMGNRVGSDPHHHPRVDVMTETFHRRPIAHERGWTVRHAGPAVAENFDIVPAVPAGPVTTICYNRVPQDSAFIQKIALNQELYRRPAIAFDHNIELEHRCLRGSSKQSHVWRLRRGFSTRCPASPCRSSTARRPHRAGPTDGSALFRSHPAHGRMPAHLSKCLLQTCIGERCPDTNVMSRRSGPRTSASHSSP